MNEGEEERTKTHGGTFVGKERNMSPILQNPTAASTPPKRYFLTISPLRKLVDPRRRESNEEDARKIPEKEKSSKGRKNVFVQGAVPSTLLLSTAYLPSRRELKGSSLSSNDGEEGRVEEV